MSFRILAGALNARLKSGQLYEIPIVCLRIAGVAGFCWMQESGGELLPAQGDGGNTSHSHCHFRERDHVHE